MFGSSATLAIGPALYGNSGYDPVKSFTPIAMVSSVPYVMIGATNAPFKTVPELLAYAKQHPNTLNFGVPNGAPPHMLAEMFKMQTGADIQVVPYKGASTLMTDMLAGRIHAGFETTSVTLAHLKEGGFRGLAVLRDARIPALPDVPTMVESGVNGVIGSSWSGVLAPAGTPQPIIDKVRADVLAGAALAGIRGQARDHVGRRAEPVGRGVRRVHRQRLPPHRRDHEGRGIEGAMISAAAGSFLFVLLAPAAQTKRVVYPPPSVPPEGGTPPPPTPFFNFTSIYSPPFTILSLPPPHAQPGRRTRRPSRSSRSMPGLHEAAAKGDVAEIERLIKDGEKPNIQDSKSRTPLHVAVYMKQHAAARALLKLGADPNRLENDRYDIVTIAAVANDIEMLKIVAGGRRERARTSPAAMTAPR